MPSRVIRGEINESESLKRVSVQAELTFRALLLACDDFGRFDARPAKLKAALFPMRDEVNAETVVAWIEELASGEDPPIVLYEVDDRPYLHLPKWEKHRAKGRRAKESRYPPPPSSDLRGDPRKSETSLGESRPGRWTLDEGRCASVGGDAPPPADPPALEDQDYTPLGNFISKLNGEADEKRAWLASGVGLEILAAADAELADDATPKQRSGKLAQITSARWRTYLKTDRAFRGAAAIEAHRALRARHPPEVEPDPVDMSNLTPSEQAILGYDDD